MKIEEIYLELESVFSAERLQCYRNWSDNNLQVTLDLYLLNLEVSSSFYVSLSNLEVTVRNAINSQMISAWGEDWFNRVEITTNELQQKRLKEAFLHLHRNTIVGESKNSQIVSNLSFGFWTTLFSPSNHMLWGEHLHRIFNCNQPIKRKTISRSLNDLRILRNKIAHYETIIYMDLLSLYQICRNLIGMISQAALVLTDSLSNFREIHPKIPIIVDNRVNPELNLSPYRFGKN